MATQRVLCVCSLHDPLCLTSMKFSDNIDNGPRNRWLPFGDVLDSKETLTFNLKKIIPKKLTIKQPVLANLYNCWTYTILVVLVNFYNYSRFNNIYYRKRAGWATCSPHINANKVVSGNEMLGGGLGSPTAFLVSYNMRRTCGQELTPQLCWGHQRTCH